MTNKLAPEVLIVTTKARLLGYLAEPKIEPTGVFYAATFNSMGDETADEAFIGALVHAIQQDDRLHFVRLDRRVSGNKKTMTVLFRASSSALQKWGWHKTTTGRIVTNDAVIEELPAQPMPDYTELEKKVAGINSDASDVQSLLLELAGCTNQGDKKRIRRQLRAKGYRLSDHR